MPGYLPASIDIDYRCAIMRTLFIEGSLACGIYGRVFEKN
jgi:hypothetical protein